MISLMAHKYIHRLLFDQLLLIFGLQPHIFQGLLFRHLWWRPI